MYFVGRELKKTHNLIARVVEEKRQTQKSDSVSFMMRKVIDFLYRNKSSEIFQRDIEKEFSLRRSSASQLLGKMEEATLIKRQPSQIDKRLKRVVLTDKAEKKCDEFIKGIISFEESLVKDIDEREVEAFLKTLSKIQANVQKLTDKPINCKNECSNSPKTCTNKTAKNQKNVGCSI